MDSEFLLINIIDEIQEKLNTPSVYNCIKISGLLRQLLFDRHNVIDAANKNYNFEITFIAIDCSQRLKKTNQIVPGRVIDISNNFNPKINTETEPQKFTKDEFIKIIPMCYKDKYYSIHEIILFIANSEGGIHNDPQSSTKNKNFDLAHLNRSLIVFDYPPVLGLIPPITEIILESLKPLYNQIKNDKAA